MRAFRSAADALRKLGAEEVAERARAGRLRELPGIGEKTERVVLQALAGEVPSYLERLEGERPDPHEGVGAPLRALLRGDCHTHSDWSDGGSPIEVMAEAAREAGHEYVVLTDHSPRLTVANGLAPERLLQQLDELDGINERLAPFRILAGIEVDILEDGGLDQEPELLDRLDLVVASVHSKLRQDAEGMTARMVRALENPYVDILGHCTGRIVVGRGRPESTFDAEAVFATAAAHDKAIEVNCRPERLDPPTRLLKAAVEAGCRFSVDTDAHAPGQLEWQPNGCSRAAKAAVPVDRILNTRSADDLLAWTTSRS